jgi:hypothetical protein
LNADGAPQLKATVLRGNVVSFITIKAKMNSFKLMLLPFALAGAFGIASAQDDSPSLRLERKQDGILLNLVCEPISGAHVTLNNKQLTRVITPASDGKFQVDLPAGIYFVSVVIDARVEIKPGELFVQRAKNGEVHLLVNTGIESTCPCFGPDIEDLLIPVEPVVINSQIVKRKPLPKH